MVAELRGLDAEAEFIRADVRHEEDVRNLMDKTVARFGRLDVAVSNAGTVFVASDKASFSTGATFDADGGKTARYRMREKESSGGK